MSLSPPPVSAGTTTVSIIEDDADTRETLAALLSDTPGLRFLASYASGEEALSGIPANRPHVALVDIHLGGGMDGIQCVAALQAKAPEVEVLMLTCHTQTDLIFKALRAGASGYLLKKSIPTELVPAIEQVRAGGAPMSMQIAREVVGFFHEVRPPAAVDALSKRENDVLTLLAKGYLYKEIGDALGISMETVRVHLKHIYRKLHVHSRTEAAAKYFGCE
jgi:DNA-binding NarL/FixJ family response regulator